MRNINYIVLHCTATPQETTITSIQRFWKERLGWKNPGYHFLIEASGKVVQLLPITKIANGVKGYNSSAIHISYIGGKDGVDDRTIQQEQAQIHLVAKLKEQFPAAKVLGHRDFPMVNKDCPSFDVAAWLKRVGLVACLIFMASCGVKSKVSDVKVVQEKSRKVESLLVVERETQIFGDTLWGAIPLPGLNASEFRVPLESAGLKLDLHFKTGQLNIKAVSKPVSKINSIEKASQQASFQNKGAMDLKQSEAKRIWRPPWFIWLIVLIFLVALAVNPSAGISLFKNLLNKLKNLLKSWNQRK